MPGVYAAPLTPSPLLPVTSIPQNTHRLWPCPPGPQGMDTLLPSWAVRADSLESAAIQPTQPQGLSWQTRGYDQVWFLPQPHWSSSSLGFPIMFPTQFLSSTTTSLPVHNDVMIITVVTVVHQTGATPEMVFEPGSMPHPPLCCVTLGRLPPLSELQIHTSDG